MPLRELTSEERQLIKARASLQARGAERAVQAALDDHRAERGGYYTGVYTNVYLQVRAILNGALNDQIASLEFFAKNEAPDVTREWL